MQPTFIITNPLQQLSLEKGKGSLIWTITNTTKKDVRGRLDLDIDLRQGIESDWFVIEEPVIRVFGPNETCAVRVNIEIPTDVDEQQPRLSLTASNVERPQEDYQIGPAVSIRDLHWETGPKQIPWYLRRWVIISISCTILVILGLVIALIIGWVNRDRLKDKTLTETLIYIHKKELDLGDIQWAFDPTIRKKMILQSGTILQSEIKDDEVTLLIQLWHPYSSSTALGFTRKQRSQNVELLNSGISELAKTPLPLENWMQFENEDELTNAKENAVPIDFYSTDYQVSFDEAFIPPKK